MVTTIFLMVFFQIFYGMLHKHMALFDDVLSNGLAQKSLELIMHVKSFAKKHILTCVLALSKIWHSLMCDFIKALLSYTPWCVPAHFGMFSCTSWQPISNELRCVI